MPNGKFRRRDNRGYYNKQNNEHDDRMVGVARRVSFKNNSKNNRQMGWDNKVKANLMDEDCDMVPQGRKKMSFHMQNPNRKGRSNRDDGNQHRRLTLSPSYWYKVTIRFGHKYDRNYLLQLLSSYIKPHKLEPYGFKAGGEDVFFIIGDHKTAVAILSANKQITLSDNYRMCVVVRPVTPYIEIGDQYLTHIKTAMGPRFVADTKSLNLSAFHADPYFIERDIFCPLNRPNVMTAVLQIIGDSIPDLQALDVSNNKINTVEHMKIMIEKLPTLRALHLGANKLRHIKGLEPIKGLGVTEIILDENTLCNQYKTRDAYIRAVRDYFPKVIKLDQIDLPPPILFVDDEASALPPSRASFMCDGNSGPALVKQFLEQYFLLYDSETRQPLLQAYHEESEFSLTCHSAGDTSSLASYIPESRNIFKSNLDRNVKLLRKGKLKIVNALSSLPQSQHDPASFAVDLVLFSPQIIQIMVMGVFREVKKKNAVRSFSRAFLLVPAGAGLCIINEMLFVTNATDDQIRKSFKVADPVVVPPAMMPGPVTGLPSLPVGPMPSVPAIPNADLELKQRLIAELASKTGMNFTWSEKCLIETNWDLTQALFAFSQLHKTGTVPAEAFIK